MEADQGPHRRCVANHPNFGLAGEALTCSSAPPRDIHCSVGHYSCTSLMIMQLRSLEWDSYCRILPRHNTCIDSSFAISQRLPACLSVYLSVCLSV